jgi:HAD superfamily hydrolase (TIGR01549 family)
VLAVTTGVVLGRAKIKPGKDDSRFALAPLPSVAGDALRRHASERGRIQAPICSRPSAAVVVAGSISTKAVLLDALGTVIELRIEAEGRLKAAFGAEMAYYRDHAHEARDAESLADLRLRCAALLSREAGREVSVDEMMAAIRFRAYPDTPPALDALHERGLRLACVSNWDYALDEVLEWCGLGGRFDVVVTSAGAGARKPDPRIFAIALEALDCAPAGAVHVGDTPAEDVEGARAAGIRALLLDRDGGGDIASLTELPGRIGGG